MKRYFLLGILLLAIIGTVSATTATYCVTATATDGTFLNTTDPLTLFEKTGGVFDTFNSTDYYISPRLTASATSNKYASFRKKGVCIDTSGIPDSATVTAANVSWILGNPTKTNGLGSPTLGIVGFSPASTTLTATDGDTNGTTKYATDIAYAAVSSSVGSRLTIDLNTEGIAAVNKTGYTCYMATFGDWDIDSDSSSLTWAAGSATSYFNLKDMSYGANTTLYPWINVTYTETGTGSVAFSANATGPFAPVVSLSFTDASNVTTPTGYKWEFKDYSNTSSVWNQIATTQNVAAYKFGAGNFSIRLNVTNATSTYSSSAGYYWANVSAGVSGNSTLLGTYRLYPDDSIFYVKKDNLSVDSATGNSSKWLAAMRAGATTDYINHFTNGSLPYYVVNDTISHQLITSPHGTPHEYHENGSVPMPDDVSIMLATGSDKAVALVDADNEWLYEVNYLNKQLNGTWVGECTIWNFSQYDNRISPGGVAPSSHDGDIYRNPVTGAARTGLISWWPAASMSGMPIFELYPRYEEVHAGAINHSLTIAVDYASGVNIWPAQSSGHWGVITDMPPAGALIRLKSTYSTAGLGPEAKVIAQALQVYGGFVTENTGNVNPLTINIVNDTRWDFADLDTLKTIKYSDFEFVDASPLKITQLSYQVNAALLAPGTSFTANVTTGASPLNVKFTDSSTGTPTNWDWYWFDNETKSSDLQSPTNTFTTGTYSVRLYTSNAHGGTWLNRTDYIVVSEVPVADFSASATSGPEPLSVTFTDTSTFATIWAWDFTNDGTTDSTDQNPTYIYAADGVYTVKLVASNAYGSDTETKAGYITVTSAAPVAAFSANHTTGNAPFNVLFTDSSTNTPTSWNWSFGDGSYSNLQSPTHTYAVLGSFTVTLNATNTGGSDLETKSGYISVVAFPDITYTPTPTPAPSTGPGSHPRAMAATPIPTIPNEHYLPILGMLAMGDEETTDIPNWSAVPLELMEVYTDYMGPIAFLIIFLIPFGMMWLAHGNMKLLAILGLITCGFVFLYLPANYQAAAVVCMLVSIATGVWSLFK